MKEKTKIDKALRRKIANRAFLQSPHFGDKEKSTLSYLLEDPSVFQIIAENLIFLRITALCMPFQDGIDSKEAHFLRKKIKSDRIKMLIARIIKKKANAMYSESSISNSLEKLFNGLTLSNAKSDEWAIHFLSRLYSSHSKLELFFIADIYVASCLSNMTDAWLLRKRSLLSTLDFRDSAEGLEQYEALSFLPEEINELRAKQAISVTIPPLFLTLWLACQDFFGKFDQHYSPYLLFSAALFFLTLSLVTGKIFLLGENYDLIFSRPWSWKNVDFLMREQIKAEIQNNNPLTDIKKYSTTRVAISPEEKIRFREKFQAIPADISTESTSPVSSEEPTTDGVSAVGDQEPSVAKEKRKTRSAIPSLPVADEKIRIRLTWAGTTLALFGYLLMRNEKHYVDIILPLEMNISRAWSTQASINSACENHFFLFRNLCNTRDRAQQQLKEIIQFGHVIPPRGHTGIVALTASEKSRTPALTKAGYKVKSHHSQSAKYRIPLNLLCSDSQLTIVDEAGQELPKQLPAEIQEERFTLYETGSIYCGH